MADTKIIDLKKEKTTAFNRTAYGDVIRTNRIKMGLTQPKLAAILNVSKNYVSNWESGFARPDMNLVPALCRALGISIAAFFGGDDLTPEQRTHLHNYALLTPRDQNTINNLTEYFLNRADADCREAFRSIFHNDLKTAAGTVNYLGDGLEGEYEYIRKDKISERADEIITVTGDSMEPTFHEGDDLFVEHTETLKVGEIGIFVVNGEGFVKEYRKNGLYSHNATAYPFRKFCPDDNVRIIGRVLGKVTKAHRPTREEMTILNDINT